MMVDDERRVRLAAQTIAKARLAGRRQTMLDAAIRPRDEAEAYRVQAALHDELRRAGHGRVVGHKIGCTTPVMQRYLGIDNPCAGGVFDTTVQHGDAVLDSTRHQRLGVECEIAVGLNAELPPRPDEHDRQSVRAAVGAVMPAIEVVEDRYDDFRRFDTPTLIADDFFNAGCVLGPALEAWRETDIAAVEGTMTINRDVVGRGHGRDILGHPLEALAWLANHLNARGDRLRAGEFVLLGSLVQTVWLDPADRAEIAIEHLGSARLFLD
jgi:2-keto-4-pentenoate hydratase